MNANLILNENYVDFHQNTNFECWLYGAANSGKSYAIADKLLLQTAWQRSKEQLKTIVLRKTLPALRRSAMDILETRARDLELPWSLNKQEMVADCLNMQFVFLSTANKEDFHKLKSMTNVDFAWINELLEIRESDYDEIVRRVRGGQSDFEQIIADFNPEDKFSWVFKRGWESPYSKDIWKSHRTVYDNHPDYLKTDKAQREIARLMRYKDIDHNQYVIYFKGEWGSLKGVIFDWDIVELPAIEFDEIFYGGDFGFSVDPAAIVKIYRKADEFWVEELLYQTDLTNPQLVQRMRDLNVPRGAVQIWDSAEPKSITELHNGGFNVHGCLKGPDSVRFGIDVVKSKKIHIVDGSMNLIREAKRYTWKVDRNGNPLNEPIEENDHLMAAIRYAIYTKYPHKPSKPARAAMVDIRSWAETGGLI